MELVKSHVEAPAVYLKNFTCQKGAYKKNSDLLYAYDKIDGTWHYDYHPRDGRFTTLNFFSQDVETYDDTNFATFYDRLYAQVVRNFSAGLEIPVKNLKRMIAFVANLRARQISDNLPETFRNYFEVRNSLIRPAMEVFQNGYYNEILYIRDAMGGFITGDSPLLSVGPKDLLLSNAAICVLPLDFEHVVMLLQWRMTRIIPRSGQSLMLGQKILCKRRILFALKRSRRLSSLYFSKMQNC